MTHTYTPAHNAFQSGSAYTFFTQQLTGTTRWKGKKGIDLRWNLGFAIILVPSAA
jgi:hypothetical protein